MVRVRLAVDLGDPALFGADRAGEVAEVVDRQRDVGAERLTHRLAVVPALDDGQLLEVGLHHVRDRVQHGRPLGGRPRGPRVLGRVGGVERELDVGGRGVRDLADHLARDGRAVLAVVAVDRRDECSADEVAVLRGDRDRTVG